MLFLDEFYKKIHDVSKKQDTTTNKIIRYQFKTPLPYKDNGEDTHITHLVWEINTNGEPIQINVIQTYTNDIDTEIVPISALPISIQENIVKSYEKENIYV